MISIYTCDVEDILVGKYNGTLEEATKYVESIILKHGFEDYLYTKKINNGILISIDSNEKKRFSFDRKKNPLIEKYHLITEELADLGDVRGDYAFTFFLEEEEIVVETFNSELETAFLPKIS